MALPSPALLTLPPCFFRMRHRKNALPPPHAVENNRRDYARKIATFLKKPTIWKNTTHNKR